MTLTDRQDYRATEARWRDMDGAQDRWERRGDTTAAGEDAVYRLRQCYPSREDAQEAAEAKCRSLVQGTARLSLTLPGDPRIAAQMPLRLSGFGQRIDGRWIVDSVTHEIGDRGFVTSLEAAPPTPG